MLMKLLFWILLFMILLLLEFVLVDDEVLGNVIIYLFCCGIFECIKEENLVSLVEKCLVFIGVFCYFVKVV